MWKKILFGLSRPVMGINRRNICYVYPGASRRYFRVADEKLLAKEYFQKAGVGTPETYLSFDGFMDLSVRFHEILPYENFVIKPNRGRQGSGIMILGKKTETGWLTASGREVSGKAVRKHLADIIMGVYSRGMGDVAVIEKRIFPHPFLKEIYPVGLADIRIIVYDKKPVMGMVRIPTAKSEGKANLHQGGIGIGLDIVTGRTTFATQSGKQIDHHPDTGVKISGMDLPFFPEMLQMAVNVASIYPLRYIGFDFTLDESRGPILIEMNARPGLEIQNANRKGLREVLE